MRSEATNTLRLCIVLCVLSLPAEAASQTPQELCASSLGEGRSQDGSARIAWARDRSLTWTDFQAKAPAQAVEAAGSCVGFDVSWECADAGITFVVKAAFDPAQSWVRAGSETDALLRHEQTHFDLTELFARRLRKQFTQLKDPCKDPQGARRIIDGAVIDMYRGWGQAQKSYDEETGQGTEASSQRAWDQRTQQELDALKEFEPGR